MKQRIGQLISENTPISISLLISIIGGIVWISNISAKAESNSQAVHRIEENQREYTKNLQEINERLSRIEGRLGQP